MSRLNKAHLRQALIPVSDALGHGCSFSKSWVVQAGLCGQDYLEVCCTEVGGCEYMPLQRGTESLRLAKIIYAANIHLARKRHTCSSGKKQITSRPTSYRCYTRCDAPESCIGVSASWGYRPAAHRAKGTAIEMGPLLDGRDAASYRMAA